MNTRASVLAIPLSIVGLTACDYLQELEDQTRAENAAQQMAANDVYPQLRQFDRALKEVATSTCDPARVSRASLGRAPLTLDYPWLAYGLSDEVIEDWEKQERLKWWSFLRSPVFTDLRPQPHFLHRFDAAAAQAAMNEHGLTAIYKHAEVTYPRLAGDDAFVSGTYAGVVALFDNQSSALLCAQRVTAHSSPSLFTMGGALGALSGGEGDQLKDDFRRNIQAALEARLAQMTSGQQAISMAPKSKPKKKARNKQKRRRKRRR